MGTRMTPSIQSRRDELAINHASQYKNLGVAVYESSEYDFKAGFDAGRTETIKMVLGLLRSEEAMSVDFFQDQDLILTN